MLLSEDVWLEGGREYFVRGDIQSENVLNIHGGAAVFRPQADNLAKRELMGAHAIVDTQNGTCPVRLMHVGHEKLHLFKGTHLGNVEPCIFGESRIRQCQNGNESDLRMKAARLQSMFVDQMKHLLPVEKRHFKEILSDFVDVFSYSKFDLGLAKDVVHQIDTGEARPVCSNPRRVPLGVEEKVDELVEQMLQNNIIRPSQSPWNAPIVVVAKKNGDIRMCVDYRRLNAVTRRPIFPIPEAQHLFDTLEGAGFFSALDLSQGYHQVPVAEPDISKTAFTTRTGQYEYLRMPFGLCSAPATFQQLMHSVLKRENWVKCLIYLDDILVFGKTIDEHCDRLRAVLQRIREAGLKLSPEKCHLFQRRVEYLGHVISAEGIRTSTSKVDKVENWPTPTNIDELRSFLGLSGYYRRFIKNYAHIVAPLEKLCLQKWNKKKKTKEVPEPWQWTQQHEEVFQYLKWCLTHSPVLVFPTKEGRFILDTDASHDCIGAVLSQVQNGEERVLAYASHRLSKAERGYCITRKELLAVYRYVLHFKHYLYGRRFTVRTDHQALVEATQHISILQLDS